MAKQYKTVFRYTLNGKSVLHQPTGPVVLVETACEFDDDLEIRFVFKHFKRK